MILYESRWMSLFAKIDNMPKIRSFLRKIQKLIKSGQKMRVKDRRGGWEVKTGIFGGRTL